MKTFLLFFTIPIVTFAADKSVEIIAQDGKFSPTVIELKASDVTTLIVINKGVDAEEFESIELNKEKIVLPGKTIKVKLGALKPGTYKFFGDFHPTTALGTIVVKED